MANFMLSTDITERRAKKRCAVGTSLQYFHRTKAVSTSTDGGGGGRSGCREENGDGRRLGVVNTQYNIQMMCYRIAHLKSI